MKNNSPLFRLYLTILFFISLSSFSQNQKTILQDFQEEYVRFENENKLDSINFLIQSYLEKENLNEIEKQLLYYYKGVHYTKINRNQEAIVILKKSISLYNNFEKSALIKKLSFCFIADAYFTLKDYKKAYFFAEKAKENLNKEKFPSIYINLHAILGYYHFLELDYDKSLKNYALSRKAALKYSKCKVSEIDLKIARILSRKNEFYKAKQTIDKAIKRSDSCGEKVNKINALKCLRDILVENRKFEDAQKTFETIENLTGSSETENRNKKIDSLETLFKTKLKEQQNELLKKQNLNKESDLKSQRIALFSTLFGLLILSLLLFYVFQLSKKQKQSNKELERLNLLNQKIFSVISHDFKGPITTLKMMLSKEEIINQNSSISAYLKDIKQQLDQSDNMLNSLLDWAKIELMVNITNENEINLKNTIATACNELSAKAQDKKIILNNSIPEGSTANFNASVLGIVLRNVLSNAIKFSFENAEIDIFYAENSIFIKDYGKGIDAKKLEKLFKQNLNPGLGTHFESGFGIGLYLCQELMIKNNGILSVENNKTEGCTFRITLSN